MSFNSRKKDIIESIEIILENKKKYGKSKYDNFAIERAIMIISESMKVLSRKYEISWEDHSEMVQMGDYIDHRYHSIDYSVVINTIKYDLPELLKVVEGIFEK